MPSASSLSFHSLLSGGVCLMWSRTWWRLLIQWNWTNSLIVIMKRTQELRSCETWHNVKKALELPKLEQEAAALCIKILYRENEPHRCSQDSTWYVCQILAYSMCKDLHVLVGILVNGVMSIESWSYGVIEKFVIVGPSCCIQYMHNILVLWLIRHKPIHFWNAKTLREYSWSFL